ncbi:putative ribonuclease H protein, partial [Mucuna pruriens]
MSGGNDGGGSWGSRFLKVASIAAATAAAAGGLYALLSSSASANSEVEVPFGAQRDTPLRVNNEGATARWTKPEITWAKLNVDGSREHFNGPSAGCGGFMRDASGKWLCGFAKKLNPNYQAHQTELQAIVTGLELAWEMNVKNLIVMSDSDSVVSMVENGVKPNHPDYDVVELIRTKRRHFDWEVRFVSIPNKANRVAHTLANEARKLHSYDLKVYYDPPSICAQLLLEDE